MMILGVVKSLQPVHGYDVRRELLSWHADKWSNVQPGSIYHGLRKLTEEKLLCEVGTEQVGGRPARTTYEITERGEGEFQRLLQGYWWEVRPVTDPFMAAFSFLPDLSRAETATALRNRAQQLRSMVDGLGVAGDMGWLRDKPAYVTWMFELWMARADGEIAWCERIAGLVESGVSYLPESVAEEPVQPSDKQ